MKKSDSLLVAFIPVLFLIALLAVNVLGVFKDDSVSGANQLVLMLSAGVAALLGIWNGTKFEHIVERMADNIKDTFKPIVILFLIGGLAGTWLISGVIPAMVYYGLDILNPQFFLPASLILCAVVSLATGSSWGTTATIGIALMGIGETMQMNPAIVAGAVISGAYFGDKLSPMSDTTNLAPAMAGTDLFTHIKYMMLTTIPSVVIALILFIILGIGHSGNVVGTQAQEVQIALDQIFNISPWLLLVPVMVIAMIALKVDALIALLFGVLIATPFALFMQPDLIHYLGQEFLNNSNSSVLEGYYVIFNAITVSTEIPSDNEIVAGLLTAKGMVGMLSTIWLVIAAMMFGGAMEATGFLNRIARAIISFAHSTATLIASTLVTTGLLNITASDQFLAIVVPGRMFKDIYKDRGLAPENLSRSLEDGGTVTSPLIPWNTCGAYQSATLGVATGDYWVYCFFNIISPLMSLFYAIFGIKIKYLEAPKEDELKVVKEA